MNPLTDKLLQDLRRAAELRAGGMSWDQVAANLGRRGGTCSVWPSRYPDLWRGWFREATRRLVLEAAAEARTALRTLLRSDDDKLKLAAAQHLLKATGKRASKSRPAHSDDDAALAAFIRELKDYSDEDLDRALEESSHGDRDHAPDPAGAARPE